jgi:hypothetical protein
VRLAKVALHERRAQVHHAALRERALDRLLRNLGRRVLAVRLGVATAAGGGCARSGRRLLKLGDFARQDDVSSPGVDFMKPFRPKLSNKTSYPL